jgi:hypothetical protein
MSATPNATDAENIEGNREFVRGLLRAALTIGGRDAPSEGDR